MQLVSREERKFGPFEGAPGMEVCVLSEHGDGGVTLLVKLAVGAKVPHHSHLGTEESVILEGRVDVGGKVAGPGDYVRMDLDEKHEVRALEPTVFFVVVNKGYQLTA